MTDEVLALAPFFAKGVAVIITAFVLFVGSVYMLLAAYFGLRMGYLVLAVSFFGWMIVLSSIWVLGPQLLGTPPNLGPRGTEPHWQVFAAGTGEVESEFAATATYPDSPWHAPDKVSQPSVDSVKTAIQQYLAARAAEDMAGQGGEGGEGGEEVHLDPTTFVVQDISFATVEGTHLAAGHGFFSRGGPEVSVFAYHDSGNVPVYSFSFLAGSILGFAIHLPFLDRAERRRKEILTGGAAPPWYGPA